MAVVKFVASGCPMRNALDYVTRDEATERKLVDGIRCSPETAAEDFRFVKERFGKENSQSLVGIQMASAYLGSTLAPRIFGWISDWAGMRWYPVYLLFYALLMLAMTEYAGAVLDRKKRSG